jgi:hypothetical protein
MAEGWWKRNIFIRTTERSGTGYIEISTLVDIGYMAADIGRHGYLVDLDLIEFESDGQTSLR